MLLLTLLPLLLALGAWKCYCQDLYLQHQERREEEYLARVPLPPPCFTVTLRVEWNVLTCLSSLPSF